MILNRFSLQGKRALVTGSATGLGQAMAIALAEAGADVACHSRTRGQADSTLGQIEGLGRKAIGVVGDLSETSAPANLISEAFEQLGGLDILINNAGTIRRSPAIEFTEDDWTDVLNVNLSSIFRMSQTAGRHMVRQGSGKIVNIASLLSFQGGINVPAYAAAKSGVAGLTKALSNEWAKLGVNVNAIAPGYISTNNTAALQADETRNRQILERIPAGRWGVPEDLGGSAVFLSSAASDYLHGHIMVVDGGWMGR